MASKGKKKGRRKKTKMREEREMQEKMKLSPTTFP